MHIETEILNILDGSALDGHALRLPPGALPRNTYLAVNKVIEAAGGKWDRKAKAHLFEGEAADVMDQIIATGEVISKKQEMQQFWTPPELAERVIELAKIERGHKVYEPSAGKGALLRAMLPFRPDLLVCANEIDLELKKGLVTEFYHWFGAGGCGCTDFLTIASIPRFDRICMNPPYARQADIRHVSHAMGFLKPGGRLVAIMSAGTMFRENSLAVAFRATIAALDGRFEMLPAGSFKESGTMVSACVLVVDV